MRMFFCWTVYYIGHVVSWFNVIPGVYSVYNWIMKQSIKLQGNTEDGPWGV